MKIAEILADEKLRHTQFPVTAEQIFLAHAGVATLPLAAADALREYAAISSCRQQEADFFALVNRARNTAAQLIGASADEIALLGPTSLGLSLVANGLDWQPDDQVVCYRDDYPANVYPWLNLAERGVRCELLETDEPGRITWEALENVLTSKTRLVALATANFVSGARLLVDEIGKKLHERGILFSVDAIQTLGVFPLNVEHIDFLSADSHKWMLGPCGAGFFYVKRQHFARLQPTLLGAWNVVSPDFIAQDRIEFYDGARRYEPGSLNLPGIVGMTAALELLQQVGIAEIAERLSVLRQYLLPPMEALGFRLYGAQDLAREEQSGIMTFVPPARCDTAKLVAALAAKKITVSLRHNRQGQALLRISPHFYNTEEELSQLLAQLKHEE